MKAADAIRPSEATAESTAESTVESTAESTGWPLIQAAAQAGALPPEATGWAREWLARQAKSSDGAMHWMFGVLGFFGSQLVVWPLLVLLGYLFWSVLLNTAGSLFMAAGLMAAGLALQRPPAGMARAQLGFAVLAAGLVVLVVRLMWLGTEADIHPDLLLFVLIAVLLACAALAAPPWAQALLALLATLVALNWFRPRYMFGGLLETSLLYPFSARAINASVLALAWAACVASEGRVDGRAQSHRWLAAVQARGGHMLAGVALALLLAALYVNGEIIRIAAWQMADMGGAAGRGSADMGAPQPLPALFRFSIGAALQLALTLIAAGWLAWHWRLRQAGARSPGLIALAYGVLLLACFFMPLAGVVALVGTVALGTHRRRLLALALFVLLLGLSGFYYALQWPLANKAALLAATGAALGVLLAALHWGTARPHAKHAQGARQDHQTAALPAGVAAALIALGTLAALALVRHDVAGKEAVIAHGEKIHVPLAPVDPRSLMQGDYMALNFAIPVTVRQALDEAEGARQARVVARVNAQGIATVLRVAQAREALATDERLLPVQRKNGNWTLVTDAYHFPEGQGRPFLRARYGEFRALPDGRALLVGLTDENLKVLEPETGPETASDSVP